MLVTTTRGEMDDSLLEKQEGTFKEGAALMQGNAR